MKRNAGAFLRGLIAVCLLLCLLPAIPARAEMPEGSASDRNAVGAEPDFSGGKKTDQEEPESSEGNDAEAVLGAENSKRSDGGLDWMMKPVVSPAALAGLVLGTAVLSAGVTGAVSGKKRAKAIHGNASGTPVLKTAGFRNIGKRRNQQDNFSIVTLPGAALAVVADGMGGLENGELVSGLAVKAVGDELSRIPAEERHNCLYGVLRHANDSVNAMLGPDGIYRSGSTLISVLAEKRGEAWSFQWISVGDSRICLFRGGQLQQINREHTYLKNLLVSAVRGEIETEDAFSDSKRGNLTSFIGMGELSDVDGSLEEASLREGDALLLMSDGVFRSVSEEKIADILTRYPEPEAAAAALEKAVLAARNANQDNFTAVILRLCAE